MSHGTIVDSGTYNNVGDEYRRNDVLCWVETDYASTQRFFK